MLVLTGPTATGKTDVALALAERHQVALISMDSAMVYRGMDIGTAKPSVAVRRRHPHALVDVRDPAEPYSAADFVAEADRAVRDALDAGRLPVLVGGTMLYLKAFREGLAELPPGDPEVRAELDAEASRRGWPALYRDLERIDPIAAAGLHPNNHVRVQRALEVYRVTGEPISRWWSAHAGRPATERLGVHLVEVALVPERRRDLDEAIDRRFRAMVEAGLVEEVAALKARGDLSLALPSMRAVGYRQVWEYLDGDGDRAALAERGAAATRSLAKRQLTWLGRWPHLTRLTPAPPAHQARRVAALGLA
ncbi:MAG TPA: tRNA (adenosine(37)-N6)-dimethylallyltransferase MiaA [Pseudomonadales bacterium]